MTQLPELLRANARWAADMQATEPGFFAGLVALQSPDYLDVYTRQTWPTAAPTSSRWASAPARCAPPG